MGILPLRYKEGLDKQAWTCSVSLLFYVLLSSQLSF